MTRPRLLCYAPYNRWAIHGLWEMTILHAARLRGADVQYVMCDGLYTDCDVWWESRGPRPGNACAICQDEVTRLVAALGMEYRWLGRYLTLDEEREARRWADALTTQELASARYGDWAVADWVRSSVQSHFRISEVDVEIPAVERAMRSYVYSGLVACFALDRLIADADPDVMLVFNGRQSSTRVAFELARARGIRVIVHERAPRTESLTLFENAHCLSLEPFRRYWEQWGEVPLSADELAEVEQALLEREYGRNLGWTAFTAPPQPIAETREALGLSANRPVWSLFTSSDDEVAGDPDHDSPFGVQLNWVQQTIEHARRNPEIDLVIRVHPNTGGKRSTAVNRVQLEQMDSLRPELPENVRMVAPDDDISSYSLMEMSAVGLVWASTAGVELACKGKQVVVAAGNFMSDVPFAHTVHDAGSYDELLSGLHQIPPGASYDEVRRLALRLAHGVFVRMRVPFPLVKMPDPHRGELQYTSTDALRPGRDPNLDRCVSILLDGAPAFPAPTEVERVRSIDAENHFLELRRPRGTTVLAYADELIADAALLAVWGRTFTASDDVTLLIQTRDDETEQLVEVVDGLGIGGDGGPRMVAESYGSPAVSSATVVYTRETGRIEAQRLRQIEPDSISALAGVL